MLDRFAKRDRDIGEDASFVVIGAKIVDQILVATARATFTSSFVFFIVTDSFYVSSI